MPVAVLRFPGGRAEETAALARRLLPDAFDLWYAETALPPGTTAVVIAGSGVAAPVMEAVRQFASAGGPALGVGGGFATLCEAGLLPGRVQEIAPTAASVHLRVEGKPTPFSASIPAGRVLRLSAGSLSWRYEAGEGAAPGLGQVIFRFCDAAGGIRAGVDPTGSLGIAGVCSAGGNVAGALPGVGLLADGPGRQLFDALALFLARRPRGATRAPTR